MASYQQFTIRCACGNLTSKAYARAHGGKCKACFTGVPSQRNTDLICPDCRQRTLTPYQKARGYHCDNCTREADPEGYRREVMGLNEPMYDGNGYADY